jgi:hypothetical protein
MNIVVVLVGALIALIGLAVIIAPSTLKKALWSFIESDRFYLIAIVRIVLGVLFLLAAGQTRSPLFINIVGVFMILAGLLIPVLGKTRVRAVAEWWMKKGDGMLRVWGVMALLFGVILARAGL